MKSRTDPAAGDTNVRQEGCDLVGRVLVAPWHSFINTPTSFSLNFVLPF